MSYPLENQIIIVDKTYKTNKKKISYKDVGYDCEGWADAKKFLPACYDLCILKTKTRNLNGWHTGSIWDGSKIKSNEDVLCWKRING